MTATTLQYDIILNLFCTITCIRFENNLILGSFSTLHCDNHEFTIDQSMVDIRSEEKLVHVEDIIPSIVEPSFGIGRIMYALFEHHFKIRDGNEYRPYFTLPAVTAPLKCSVLPLIRNAEFVSTIRDICE